MKLRLLGKKHIIKIIIAVAFASLLLQLFIESVGARSYLTMLMNVMLACLGALFGLLFSAGDEKFNDWFNKDIISEFIMDKLNTTINQLKVDGDKNWGDACQFTCFDDPKEFVLLEDDAQEDDAHDKAESKKYRYITFLAKKAFLYRYINKDGDTNEFDLHLKIVFRCPDYNNDQLSSRRRIYTRCTVYSDNEKISKYQPVMDSLNKKLRSTDLKVEKSWCDELFGENVTRKSENLELRKNENKRPLQYWIGDVIEPQKLMAEDENLKLISYALITSIRNYMKSISCALSNMKEENTNSDENKDDKTPEALETDNSLEITMNEEYFFNHEQYKKKYYLGYDIIKSLIKTKNMKADEIKSLAEDLKKKNSDNNIDPDQQKEIIKQEGDWIISKSWFDIPVHSFDDKKFYIIKYWSKEHIENLMEVLKEKKLLISITYKF